MAVAKFLMLGGLGAMIAGTAYLNRTPINHAPEGPTRSAVTLGDGRMLGSTGIPWAPGKEPTSLAPLAEPVASSVAEDVPKADPLAGWHYKSETDSMRGTADSFARLASTTRLHFSFPYNRGQNGVIIQLRHTARWGTEAFFEIVQGQFDCGYDGCSVPIKFDNGALEHVWCHKGEGSDTLFVGDPKPFIARLKRTKHLFIEASFFQEGTNQIEFDTSGLDLEQAGLK